MKLGWREIWLRVSRIRSRVSPRAGVTSTLDGVEIPVSESFSGGPRAGLAGTGVPGLGEPVYSPFPLLVPGGGAGGASLSTVNAKKSSCWSFKWCRIVSKTVDIVRKAEWIDGGYIQGWNIDQNKWERNSNYDVALKYLNNSQNLSTKFLQEVM